MAPRFCLAVVLGFGVNHVVSEDGGRMLTIVIPGGFEDFFAAMAAENLVIPDDMGRIGEIAGQFNLTFVGPPLPE